jgi:hypothetical protein
MSGAAQGRSEFTLVQIDEALRSEGLVPHWHDQIDILSAASDIGLNTP